MESAFYFIMFILGLIILITSKVILLGIVVVVILFFLFLFLSDRKNFKNNNLNFFTKIKLTLLFLALITVPIFIQFILQVRYYQTTEYVDTQSLGGNIEVNVEPFERNIIAPDYYAALGLGTQEFSFLIAIILAIIFISIFARRERNKPRMFS